MNFASRNFSMVHFIPMKGQDTHKVRARFGDHHMVDRKRENFLGKAGCFLSHVHVAKHVVHMNASNVVVLEDDATFMNFPADARSDLADLSLLGGRLHRSLLTARFRCLGTQEQGRKIGLPSPGRTHTTSAPPLLPELSSSSCCWCRNKMEANFGKRRGTAQIILTYSSPVQIC